MAAGGYSSSQVVGEIQRDNLKLTALLTKLAIGEISDEEKKKVLEELKNDAAVLETNNESAIDLLLKEPRKMFEDFKPPQMTTLEAVTEHQRQVAKRVAKIDEKERNIAAARAAGREPDENDITYPHLGKRNIYLYQTQAVVKRGDIAYFREIDGAVDSKAPLEYDGELNGDWLDICVEKNPITQSIEIHTTVVNIIKKASKYGLTRDQLNEAFILFVKEHIPSSYGHIKRLKGEQLFESILSLTTYSTLISNLLKQLSSVTRNKDENASIAVYSIRSVASELLSLTTPNLKESELQAKLNTIAKNVIPKVVTSETARAYFNYVREQRVWRNRDLTLDQRLAFITRIEADLGFRPAENIVAKDINAPAGLFWMSLQESGDTREGIAHDYCGGGLSDIIQSELFYGDSQPVHNTRRAGAPLQQPLHSWGDQAGINDGRRGGHSSGSSTVGGAGPANVVTEAIVHSGGVKGAGQGAGLGDAEVKVNPDQSFTNAWNVQVPAGPANGTDQGWNTKQNNNLSRQARSPNSGRKQMFFKDERTGDFQPLSRGQLFTYNQKQGNFQPRPRSKERMDMRKFKTPESVPDGYCTRCFRRIPPSSSSFSGQRCSANKCLRYGSAPIPRTQCSCAGGFHARASCGRGGVSLYGKKGKDGAKTGQPKN